MIGFLATYADRNDWTMTSKALVYAEGREHCKRVLGAKLAHERIFANNPDEWVIEPITPVPNTPYVILIGD